MFYSVVLVSSVVSSEVSLVPMVSVVFCSVSADHGRLQRVGPDREGSAFGPFDMGKEIEADRNRPCVLSGDDAAGRGGDHPDAALGRTGNGSVAGAPATYDDADLRRRFL